MRAGDGPRGQVHPCAVALIIVPIVVNELGWVEPLRVALAPPVAEQHESHSAYSSTPFSAHEDQTLTRHSGSLTSMVRSDLKFARTKRLYRVGKFGDWRGLT